MQLAIYKKIKYNKTLYKSTSQNDTVSFILVDNTDVLSDCFVYDITFYWKDYNSKRCFRQARHKENFLDNAELLAKALNDNIKMFPCNAEHGWKDSELTEKDLKLIEKWCSLNREHHQTFLEASAITDLLKFHIYLIYMQVFLRHCVM